MNDKEMLEFMTTSYERDTKLFEDKIAELKEKNDKQVSLYRLERVELIKMISKFLCTGLKESN